MEQPNSKLTYIALALALGSICISTATVVISGIANSARIAELEDQLGGLEAINSLQDKLLADSRNRIEELDMGLTAVSNVAKIDRDALAKAMAEVKQRNVKATADHQAETGRVIEDEKAVVAAVMPKTPEKPSAPAEQKPEPKPQTGPAAIIDSPADNPFAVVMEGAGGEVSAPLSIVSEQPEPLTIAQVDAILAKRISESWYKPAGVKKELSAVIQLKMTRTGKVSSVSLVKPSGNDAFDSSAIAAFKSISVIEEVGQLSDADYQKAYARRSIKFSPQMGG